jgi:hypothetical protein
VVVPLSVLPSWMNEFAKWCPSMRVVRVHTNDADERNRIKKVGGALGNSRTCYPFLPCFLAPTWAFLSTSFVGPVLHLISSGWLVP